MTEHIKTKVLVVGGGPGGYVAGDPRRTTRPRNDVD